MSSLYYTPYLTDSEFESESESDSESESSSGYTSDSTLSVNTVSGPGSESPTQVIGSGIPASLQESQALVPAKEDYTESRNTSLIMINSRDRDTNVYPQPTFFTIRLPRTFKNIKTITITQLNLLNSFFNFSEAKGNSWMYVNELGRTITTNGITSNNNVRVQIRDGTYSASDIVTELNNAMNQTPLFADISGGLGGFIEAFQGTGDYTILFNQPGPVVYNSLTGKYDSNVTMPQLVSRYFAPIQTVGTIGFSYNECLVAYYYPVIKEMTARGITFNQYPENLPAGFFDPYTYILFGFQGLDDPYILSLIQDPANVALFDTFRAQNTFVQFLVNQYVCTYNPLQGRLQISATGLNPSIQADLNQEYQYLLTQEVTNAGFPDVSTFQGQYSNLALQNGALLEFYNFIHRNFTNSFGINFGTYTAEFFSDSNNEITMYNTIDRRGWNTSLVPAISSNAISQSQSLAPQISTVLSNMLIPPSAPGAANFLCNLGTLSTLTFSNASETTFGYTDISFSVLPTSYARLNFTSRCRQTINLMTIPRYLDERGSGTGETYPFGPDLNQTPMLFDIDTMVTPSTFIIRTDITDEDFYMYTIQQNMFMSRDYMRNENQWLNYTTPQILAGLRVQPGTPNFGTNPPLNDIALLSYRPHIFFEVRMDEYVLQPDAKWRVDICVETQDGTLFPVPIVIARYRDRAAFMTDVTGDLARNYVENPRHVFEREVFQDVSEATLTIDVLNKETSYITIHIDGNAVIPSSVPLRIFAILHDEYGVYTTATELDYRQMPWQNLPPLSDQFTPNSAIFQSPLVSIYNPNTFQLGYDISGVSNNWLDYFIQSSDNTYFDPNNIETYETPSKTGLRYLFDFETNGTASVPTNASTSWSLYFGSNTANIIRDTYTLGAGNIYLSSLQIPKAPVDGNESLLINWFRAGSNAIEEYRNPRPDGIDSGDTRIALSTGIFLACTNVNIPLSTDASTSTTFYDISGFHGLSFFMNPNDIVKLNELDVKMTYIQPSYDTIGVPVTRTNSPLGLSDTANYTFNNAATYTSIFSNSLDTWDDWYSINRRNLRVGVFNTGDLVSTNIQSVSLADAICTLTLEKVTQVANYTNTTGTLKTREPDWGTYYSYKVLRAADEKWEYSNGTWRIVSMTEDLAPTYESGSDSYPGYFLTHTNINNYNFLPRGYGIAPSVGYATSNPYVYTSSYTSDIPNSYTMVPFYNDPLDDTWKVGSFYGVSYTTRPLLPDPANAGIAPYLGPAGIFALTREDPMNTSTLTIAGTNPYYWNMKIGFETLDKDYDPATDLSMFGGFAGISGELQDTMLFVYKNTAADLDIRDISTTTVDPFTLLTTDSWTWGQESNTNYQRVDDQSGYNYLSYVNGYTVRNSTINDYAVHVRGYVPTSQFNTGLRLIGKNFTDFGTATLGEIAQEITDLSGYVPIPDSLAYQFVNGISTAYYSTVINTNDSIRLADGNFYSHQYADALIRFDALFRYPGGKTFGKRIGYSGVTFYLSGYPDAIKQYIIYYSTLSGTLAIYNQVLSTTTGLLNQYVEERYFAILPDYTLNRTRITDPLPFSLLLKSKLQPPYDTQFDEWGLGWNLGFPKEDTSYLVTQISDTFIRITQDYIYLRLNPEMNLNTMGLSKKEDLALSREPFSEDTKYFAKIILNNFGGFCRAAVQMPKQFNPVLGKYDTISLELIDRNGNRIDNADCDYDIVIEFAEVMDGARDKFALLRGR